MLTVVFAIRFSKTHAFFMIALTLFSAYISLLIVLKIFKMNQHD